MRGRKLESTPHPQPCLSWQVANRQAEKSPLASQRAPQVFSALVSAPSANAHASTLNRVIARPIRGAESVLQLQRRYGNRYVQRVMDLARKTEEETIVSLDAEQDIRRAPRARRTFLEVDSSLPGIQRDIYLNDTSRVFVSEHWHMYVCRGLTHPDALPRYIRQRQWTYAVRFITRMIGYANDVAHCVRTRARFDAESRWVLDEAIPAMIERLADARREMRRSGRSPATVNRALGNAEQIATIVHETLASLHPR